MFDSFVESFVEFHQKKNWFLDYEYFYTEVEEFMVWDEGENGKDGKRI